MFYSFSRALCRLVLAVKARWKVEGEENMPRTGPMVVVSNHASAWDPVIVGCSIRHRMLHFMAKEELFKIFFVGWLVRKLGAFPIKRGQADRSSIKESLRLLKEGHVLAMFPEGTRGSSDGLKEAHNGAAFLALKAGAPILPVAVSGSKQFENVRVKIGKPINLDSFSGRKIDKEVLEEVSRLFMEKIEQMQTV